MTTGGSPGLTYDGPPFLSLDDEFQSTAQIDTFMMDVLIPLAARTNAVVLCCAYPALCALSMSFNRMYKLMRPQWGTEPPFTVLSLGGALFKLYQNPDLNAYWRRLRRNTRSWRPRDAKLLEIS